MVQLPNKFRLFLVLIDQQEFTAAAEQRYWWDRYRINFTFYVNFAQRLHYLRFGDEPTVTTDGTAQELTQTKVCQLTPKGQRWVAGYRHYRLVHENFIPGVVDLKHMARICRRHPEGKPWEWILSLLDHGVQQAQQRTDMLTALLLQKHKIKLLQHLGKYDAALETLQAVFYHELSEPSSGYEGIHGWQLSQKYPSYEIQELRFFLEQLDLQLEDFLLRFGSWLQKRNMTHSCFTRLEIMAIVMFAYLDDEMSLAAVFARANARRNDESSNIISNK
ncbi:hypothetical protein FHQ08_09375 [Lactobacillus sp. CC-MHH1034]|uniref:hypothetical protein n=1 Tax=Agrilactobacillus fermenti TaxID=2586909 RepID=UPI001E396894|nr:hypothetical protein [Agrilactobacillus fermenti]MCD2256933.1 hypothetical protein [Agrilactobacillus fermenti]